MMMTSSQGFDPMKFRRPRTKRVYRPNPFLDAISSRIADYEHGGVLWEIEPIDLNREHLR